MTPHEVLNALVRRYDILIGASPAVGLAVNQEHIAAISAVLEENERQHQVLIARGEKIERLQNSGCTCQSCGTVFYDDVLTPDDLWNRIHPEGKPEGAGLLCGRCIGERIAEKNEVLREWSSRWKKLAQFRGWPASRHEKNRQRIKELEEAARWIRVSERQPQRHGPHVIVRRPNASGGFDYFLADPCYGMHAPWWVVDFDARNETKQMLDSDEWKVLAKRGESSAALSSEGKEKPPTLIIDCRPDPPIKTAVVRPAFEVRIQDEPKERICQVVECKEPAHETSHFCSRHRGEVGRPTA